MKHLGIASTIIGLLLITGCGSSDTTRPGSLEISWAVGGSTCSAVGISTVLVSVFDQTGLYTTKSSACQLSMIEFANLPGGLYTIQIDGFRAGADVPSYTGSVIGIDVREGTLTVAPRIELSEKPGGLDVVWRFQENTLCGFAGVDTVVLNVWDGHANRIHEEVLPCDPFAARLKAEEAQPGRVLYDTSKGIVISGLYAGQYTLRAFAYASTAATSGGTATLDLRPKFWAEARPIVTHSKLTPVELTLQSCELENPDGTFTAVSICL